jgi:hypothetical protein
MTTTQIILLITQSQNCDFHVVLFGLEGLTILGRSIRGFFIDQMFEERN